MRVVRNVPARVFRARAGVPRLVLVEAREVHVVEVEVDEIGDVVRVLGAAREGGASAKGGGGGGGAIARRVRAANDGNRLNRTGARRTRLAALERRRAKPHLIPRVRAEERVEHAVEARVVLRRTRRGDLRVRRGRAGHRLVP